jgi:isoleucyl-tRNA synthetase
MEYKDTINLFETSFPMRGDLARREPIMLEKWQLQNRYQKLRDIAKGRDKFILHDGPPYANGQLHLGHAVNKVLKDIIIRSKTLSGYDAPFIPGWDCHGLPIELNVEKTFGKNIDKKEFRDKCRSYAESQIEQQKHDFMRLGVIGQWDEPYKTMNFNMEADIVRALGDIYKNGYMFRGEKPIYWCIDCQSALAEAEVEYKNKFSKAVFVKFNIVEHEFSKLQNIFNVDEIDSNKQLSAVIWTTTLWTLPANEAICLGEGIDYSLIEFNNEYLIVASQLISNIFNNKEHVYKVIANCLGKSLEGMKFKHPFYAKQVPIILGDHVTLDAGSGMVHTAPAHGLEDYFVGLKYKLPIENPVLDNGKFRDNTLYLAGQLVWDANASVFDILTNNDMLLFSSKLEHSYPHCWRHKTPLIFRTTSQWFIGMDINGSHNDSLRDIALKHLKDIKFIPSWGRARLEAMIKNRPDWCISRQRSWCSPMTFFVHKDTGELHPDSYNILQQVAKLIETKGIDAWFDDNLSAHSLNISNADDYKKLADTLDVWFDSGVTHLSVLDKNSHLKWPADLYLEGSDQHRGWFQSSLLTACAIKSTPPFKALLTHGFVVDGKGYKMSKSLGNIVSIENGVKKYGADLIRLWVASTDYSGELSFSDEIMKRVSESYRRIRNTVRFLLANLEDFDFKVDKIANEDLLEVDRYAIIILDRLQDKIINNIYPSYQFHLLVQELVTFCSEFLGGFYLDILKDRLYTSKSNGVARRAAQTTIYYIANSLILLFAPILAFTMEEAWEILNKDENDSTLYHTFYQLPNIDNSEYISQDWQLIYDFRTIVLKELETKRIEGVIGSSLQARIKIMANQELYTVLNKLGGDLKFAYMVSDIELILGDINSVEVVLASANKCERCWHYSDTVGTNIEHATICKRCINNLFSDGEIRNFA